MDISAFKQLIEDTFGIYIDSIRTSILEKAIDQRMGILRIDNTTSYFECIRRQETELKNLVSLITVNESYFFRENSQVDLLFNTIIPELIAHRPRGYTIKLLSAGCSTGEEPYSIVIAFNEKFGAQTGTRLQIYAFDVDKQVIETAKNGIYGKSSFRSFDAQLREKYFGPLPGSQWQINPAFKKQVTFFEHNLLNTDFPPLIQHMDIIFYRNVSIYFKPRTQKRVFEKLAGILNLQGYLFMSATETFVHDIGILKLVELADCFVFKKTDVPQATLLGGGGNSQNVLADNTLTHWSAIEKQAYDKSVDDPKEGMTPIDSETYQGTKLIKETENRNHFNKVLELLRFKKQSEALDVIKFIETQFPDSKKLLMLKARILFELKQLPAATAICLGLIEKDQWYEWPYLYLGLFASFKRDNEEFVKQLKKAIYVRPTCWLAHYYLAKHYLSASSFKSAAREMRNVIRLLEKNEWALNEMELFLEPIAIDRVLSEFKDKLTQLESKPA